MDTAEIIVTVTGAALIAFNFWFFFGARDEAPVRVAGAGATNQNIYACPMHPWITSTDPAANCSICGMKLVKKD